MLQGAVNKKIAPTYFPIKSFAYVVFYLKQHQPSGAKLIKSADWMLFFLQKDGVEQLLFEDAELPSCPPPDRPGNPTDRDTVTEHPICKLAAQLETGGHPSSFSRLSQSRAMMMGWTQG